jgi:hypothetical protein
MKGWYIALSLIALKMQCRGSSTNVAHCICPRHTGYCRTLTGVLAAKVMSWRFEKTLSGQWYKDPVAIIEVQHLQNIEASWDVDSDT